MPEKLSRLEEVAVPVFIIGRPSSDDTEEIFASMRGLLTTDPGLLSSREDRNI